MTTSDRSRADIRGFTAPGFEPGSTSAFAAASLLDTRGGGRALGLPATARSSPSSCTRRGVGFAPRTPETTQVIFSCTKGVSPPRC